MTKEITKAIIMQELQDKLQLREFAPGPFLFDETVIPTYDIEPHLKSCTVKQETKTISEATSVVFYVVPMDEEWFLRAYQITFMTGAYTIAGAFIKRTAVQGDYIYMDLAAAQSESYLVNLPTIVRANPGSNIAILVDGFTSGGDLRMNLDTAVTRIR